MTARRSSTDFGPSPTRWRATLLGLAVLCAAGAGFAAWQIRPPDHGRLKQTCEKLAGAVERRDTKALEGLVSANYRDGRGLDRSHLLSNLFHYLDSRGVIHVTPLSITVSDVQKDQAHATARLWLARAEQPIRGARDAVQLDLSFHREDGRWQVTSAEDWELPAADFEQPESDSE